MVGMKNEKTVICGLKTDSDDKVAKEGIAHCVKDRKPATSTHARNVQSAAISRQNVTRPSASLKSAAGSTRTINQSAQKLVQ